MSEKEKDTTVTEELKDSVTDADLKNAYDEMSKGKETEEEPIIPSSETKDEEDEELPADQADRSRLGRRITRYESEIKELKDMVKTLVEERKTPIVPYSEIYPPEEELPEYISTREDLEKVLDSREQKKIRNQQDYSNKYLKSFKSFATEDPENFQDIFAEMEKNFNNRYSDDATRDARINWLEARNVLLNKKFVPIKPNVRGKETSPANINIQTIMPMRETPDIKLSPLAEEFVRKTGMSEKSVKEALESR